MIETYIEYEGKTIPFFVHENLITRYGRLPDYISDSIETTHHFFEQGMLEYWKEKFGTVGSFVDIGANIGNHSVFARDVLKAKSITCFEPLGASADILTKNLPEATIYRMGLASSPGEMGVEQNLMTIKGQPGVYCANAGATELIPGKGVKVDTLDNIGLKACDLMKLDVEGMEAEVLKGAVETLKRLRPMIYAEANLMVQFMDMIEVLTPLGYYLTHVKNYGNVMLEFTPKEKL